MTDSRVTKTKQDQIICTFRRGLVTFLVCERNAKKTSKHVDIVVYIKTSLWRASCITYSSGDININRSRFLIIVCVSIHLYLIDVIIGFDEKKITSIFSFLSVQQQQQQQQQRIIFYVYPYTDVC